MSVPLSIKGRIIAEILEGMVYLTENHVIHKELKPENILVDDGLHIKVRLCDTEREFEIQYNRERAKEGASE